MHVVVVGGGIVGMASAHALAERGVSVTVCEKGSIGAGNTERSAGGIRAQFSTPVNVALSQAAIEEWTAFEERFDEDIDYRRPGYLFLAREDATAEAFEAQVAMQRDHGVPAELLTPAEAREHAPGLRDEFVAATYCPTDGFADPHLALGAYARAATAAGAEIRTRTAVTDLHVEDGAVVAASIDGERVACDVVVNAAGAWARRVAAMAGLDLPAFPRRRQIAVVQPETTIPEDHPLVIDLDTGSYFRPEREGQALVGGHFAADDPDIDPDRASGSMETGWAVTAVERAADAATYFGPETRLVRGWKGSYAVTPDHHPVIEESLPGFVQAVGFSGHGFQHAPATGRLVAELACDGTPSLVDISALTSDRFERGDLLRERNVA